MENKGLNNFTDSNVFDLFNPEESCLERYKQKFEREWTTDRQFSLEDCLVMVKQEYPDLQDKDKDELFRDLLTIDINKGYSEHTPITCQEYIARFPQWRNIIHEVDNNFNLTTMALTNALIGHMIDKYAISDELGRGGMGFVFRAYDTVLNRTVALKLLLPRWQRQSKSLELFKQEMCIMAQMPSNSPFVTIYEEGDYKGDAFISMEYVRGETLISYLKQQKNNRLDYKTVLDFTIQIVKGLQTIHKLNILHRDIKPDNIMVQNANDIGTTNSNPLSNFGNISNSLFKTVISNHSNDPASSVYQSTDDIPTAPQTTTKCNPVPVDSSEYPFGRIRILDLGLGRFQTSSLQEELSTQNSQQNAGEQIIGAVAYMAPECVSDPQHVDQRCDIYSLGRTILYLLTGQHPTAWYNPFGCNLLKPEKLSRYLSKNSVKVPKKFVALLEHMLETDVSKRIENTTVLLQQLTVLQEQNYKPRWSTKFLYSTIAILFGIILGGGISLYTLHTINKNRLIEATEIFQSKEERHYETCWGKLSKIDDNYLSSQDLSNVTFLRIQCGTQLGKIKKDPFYLEKALNLCDNYLAINPDSLECLKLRANVEYLIAIKDNGSNEIYLQKAFLDIVRFFQENPNDIPALLLAGKIKFKMYLLKNDISLLEYSIDIFQEIVEKREPSSLSEARIWLANAYIPLKKYEEAISLLDEVLDGNDEHNVNARRLRAQIHYTFTMNYDLACSDIKAIVYSSYANVAAKAISSDYELLLDSYFNMKQYQECVQTCNLALDSGAPINVARILEQRGRAHQALGKKEEAEKDFQKAKELKIIPRLE